MRIIYTPNGLFYWCAKLNCWYPAVMVNGKIIPVAAPWSK